MHKEKINIAFNVLGGSQWTGGLTYHVNLYKALKLANPNINVKMLVHSQPNTKLLELGVGVISKSGKTGFIQNLIDKIYRRYLKKDLFIRRLLNNTDINVVFPQSLQIDSEKACIYWIPDFQLLHMPEMDKVNSVEFFKQKLSKYFEAADLIVVSSEDAKKDLLNFFPVYIHKARVLKFVAHIPDNLYSNNPEVVKQKYNIPKEFIYLPNQFWAHKNHGLVVKALQILKERAVKPNIICTGNPIDIRNQTYFAQLLADISLSGVRDQFILLGFVDHEDVYDLIRGSKCVLNPSLFEGWSTSVEEAKSVGKRMILSDIDVHIEQAPPESYYFKRNDAQDLAYKIEKVWIEQDSAPDIELERAAIDSYPERMKLFGNTFLAICEEALSIKLVS